MAISSGSYTVGSGGDYATWKAAIDDMTTQTGDITLTQISDVTETAQINLDHNCNGFRVYCLSSVNHLGVYIGSLKTTYNFTGGSALFYLVGANAIDTVRIIFRGLSFLVQSATSGNAVIYAPATGATNRNVDLIGNLFNLNSLNISAFATGAVSDSTKRINAYNNKAFNKAFSTTTYAFHSNGVGCTWENNIYYGTTGRGFALDGINVECYNNASYGEVGFVYNFSVSGDPVARNNASSDNSADDALTQSGNLINRVAAMDFISLDTSSADFLRLSPASGLARTGRTTTISGNTSGIRGNSRPGPDGAVSIGPDQVQATGSIIVGSGTFNVRQWPNPHIVPAIQWIQDSEGNWSGSDRGASQDVYETEVVFFDTQDNINSLMQVLENNREEVTLSDFAAPIFSPNVDHTGSITASVVSYGPRRHLAFGAASKWVYELPVTFRAISPALLVTTPSLSTLKLQDGFEATASYEVGKAFTYGQTGVYTDSRADTGRFVGRFRQQTSQAQAILAYLLTTARANSVAFPSSIPVTYPWGINRGVPTNCRIKSFSIRRVNFVFWDLELELVEEA